MSDNLFLQLAAQKVKARSQAACYENDFQLWAKERLGVHVWSKQAEIAHALINHRKVAVKSCHGSGKSYLASLIIAWWVDTRGHKNAVSVSTAPSADQVGKVVWRYVRQHHQASQTRAEDDPDYVPLPGYVTQDNEWKFDGDGELKAWGRKPADHSQSTFQGIHAAGGVLAVVDEANGVADGIWTNIYAITTGEHDRILAIANPDVAAGEFFKIFHDDNPDWYKITISAFDSPNFTNEDVPAEMRPGLIQPSWVEERRRAWGEDDPRWKSKILAEFSLDSSNLLFGYDTINAGTATEIRPPDDAEIWLGVDVARFGEDKTVVYKNHGGHVRFLAEWNRTDTQTTGDRVNDLAIKEGATQVRIDGIGIGAGVVDRVANLARDRYMTISLIGNKSSPNMLKWYNARAWWYDNTREEMRLGQLDIAFDDKKLHDELTSIGYSFPPGKGMLLESKEDLIKRLGESPDYADAFIYSVAPLGFDVNSPLATISPGEHVEVDMLDILMQREMGISPL